MCMYVFMYISSACCGAPPGSRGGSVPGPGSTVSRLGCSFHASIFNAPSQRFCDATEDLGFSTRRLQE